MVTSAWDNGLPFAIGQVVPTASSAYHWRHGPACPTSRILSFTEQLPVPSSSSCSLTRQAEAGLLRFTVSGSCAMPMRCFGIREHLSSADKPLRVWPLFALMWQQPPMTLFCLLVLLGVFLVQEMLQHSATLLRPALAPSSHAGPEGWRLRTVQSRDGLCGSDECLPS